ncbi:MAG TPA: HypC/HybG/HupF family hydrogenase formation chaperone [Rhizobium sp.]|nr:HypC/HybG/HupF family hydrogenase formation chaperone [Rhizobium sp.]
MCIGIPMLIVEAGEFEALCERHGERHRISLMLVGAQEPGTFVLTHLGSAIRVIDEAEAKAIDNALTGLSEAVDGRPFEALFEDLISREPELPEHLR